MRRLVYSVQQRRLTKGHELGTGQVVAHRVVAELLKLRQGAAPQDLGAGFRRRPEPGGAYSSARPLPPLALTVRMAASPTSPPENRTPFKNSVLFPNRMVRTRERRLAASIWAFT